MGKLLLWKYLLFVANKMTVGTHFPSDTDIQLYKLWAAFISFTSKVYKCTTHVYRLYRYIQNLYKSVLVLQYCSVSLTESI